MAVAAVPPAPTRGGGSGAGGGKGLIFGLVGVGAVLLGAIIILVVRSNKPQNTDLPPIPIPTVAATSPTPSVVQLPPEPIPPDPVPAAGGSTSAAGGGPATSGEAGKAPTATGTSKPTGTTPPKGDPCDACLAAAASGNASGVNATVSRCTDAAKQAQCKSTLGRTAVGAVTAAARNGQCDRAKALIAAADAAGVKGASRGLAGSSCK
jgi:hypothetical protein